MHTIRLPRRSHDSISIGSTSHTTQTSALERFAIVLLFGSLFLFAFITTLDGNLAQELRILGNSNGSANKNMRIEQLLQTDPKVTAVPDLTQSDGLVSTTTITPDEEPKPAVFEPPSRPIAKLQTPSTVQPSVQPTAKADGQQPTSVQTSGLPQKPILDPPAKLIDLPSKPTGPVQREGTDDNFDELSLLASGTAEVVLPGAIASMRSPDGKAELTVWVTKEGMAAYRLIEPNSGVVIIADSLLDLRVAFKLCLFRSVANPPKTEAKYSISSGRSYWKPITKGFERSSYAESFTELSTACEGMYCQHCQWRMDWRLFDSGLAIRALVKPELTKSEEDSGKVDLTQPEEWIHVHYGLHVGIPELAPQSADDLGRMCYASNLEEAYTIKPCKMLVREMMVPLAIVPSSSSPSARTFASHLLITQTAGFGFTQALVKWQEDMSVSTGPAQVTALLVVAKGEALRRPTEQHAKENSDLVFISSPEFNSYTTATSWTVITWSATSIALADRSSIIRLLAPPTPLHLAEGVFKHAAQWIHPGKLLRMRSFTTQASKSLLDFAYTHGYDLIHFDAGWYGEENEKASDPKAVHPSIAHQLDMKQVVEYGKRQQRPIGVSVYVNDIALRHTDQLKHIYKDWGLAGIKFGFVKLDKPSHMRLVHQRVLAFAEAQMYVNIHDYYRPRSFTRTWPHLLTQEGIRGEERVPDCTHHTLLPFIRMQAGSADYTPRYISMKPQCTKAHQLALPIILFSPVQSLFWAEETRVIESLEKSNPELDLWERLPTVWDDTLLLGGAPGEFVSIARRSGRQWFVGTVNSDGPERKWRMDLASLFRPPTPSHPPLTSDLAQLPREGYVVQVWSDSAWKGAVKGEMNKVDVRPVQVLFLPSVTVNSILAGTTSPAKSEAPFQLTEWATKHSVSMFILTTLQLPVFLAPGGGHAMRIIPVEEFLEQNKPSLIG